MNYEILLQAQYPSLCLFPFFDFPIKIRWLGFLKFLEFASLGVLSLIPSPLGMGTSLAVGKFLGSFYSFTKGILR
jgi:hypothetical protein